MINNLKNYMDNKILENNLIVDIGLIKPNKYNPKPDYNSNAELMEQFAKIKKSLANHGQKDSLKVRELEDGTYELVDGFHRYTAMLELGFTKAEIKNFGKISEDEAMAICLNMEDAKIPLDQLEVAELVKHLTEVENFNLELLPYTAEEIQHKIEIIEFNPENKFKDNLSSEKAYEEKEPEHKHNSSNGWVIDFDNDEQKEFVRNYIESKRKEIGISQGEYMYRTIMYLKAQDNE